LIVNLQSLITMAQKQTPLSPKTAFVVHFAMVMTIAAMAAVCWVVRDSVTIHVGTVASRVLRYFALTELVAVGLIVSRLRSGIPLIGPTDDLAEWWVTNGTRVLVTWVLAYGVGVTGAALWLLTDDVVILAAVVLASVVLLMRLAPMRWVADEPDHKSKLVP